MNTLDKIKSREWQQIVNRQSERILFRSITDAGYRYFSDSTGIEWKAKNIFRFGTGELVHAKDEMDQLREIFEENHKSFFIFKDNLKKQIKKLDEYAREIGKHDLNKASNEKLCAILEEYYEIAQRSHNFLIPMATIGKVLSEKIKEKLPDEMNKEEALKLLTYPNQRNTHYYEEIDFIELVKSFKTKKGEIEREIEEHIQKYGWIGARGYNFSQGWNAKIIKNRIKNFIELGKDPDKEKQNLIDTNNIILKEEKEMLEQIHTTINTRLLETIQLAKEFVYLRTWRTDIIYGAGCHAKNLFIEIAKRFNITTEELGYLSFEEIINIIKEHTEINLELIKKRKINYLTAVIEENYEIISDKEEIEKIRDIVIEKPVNKTIKGNCTFSGTIKGKAKIVNGTKDISKVKHGDIMVSVMTFPNLIPAMEKAAGFITDEGGILCHAAIIAREMKKPCITSTKYATKILKDNDLIELDADKGTARIIK